MGFKHRGLPNVGFFNDSFQEYQGALVGFPNGPAAGTNTGQPDQVACTPTTTTVREPFFLIAFGSGAGQQLANKHRKGSTRWWQVVLGNASTDTYDSKLWVQLSSTIPAIIVGPGDGSTVPANQ